MNNNDIVGIVIVSHSIEVARGTAAMVHEMVGREVPCAWCGGNRDGGMGTDMTRIQAAILEVWRPAGVVVFVDLGGAEMNAEMALEQLPPDKAARVVVCTAPLVEGAVMAATEAAGGASLEEVCRTAESLMP